MKTTSSAPTPSRGPVDHEVRDQVVAAATEHFSRYGYEKTTVSDLAKAIGFSKAYIYKFFESKQAIGEMICAQCIAEIEASVAASLADAASPPDKIRRLFKAFTEASLRLLFQDRKLYEIAASAATEQWAVVAAYDQRVQQLLREMQERHPMIGDVRGRGMMTAIELVADRSTKEPIDGPTGGGILRRCLENGVVILKAGTYDNVIRLLPPITIDEDLLEDGLGILDEAIGAA